MSGTFTKHNAPPFNLLATSFRIEGVEDLIPLQYAFLLRVGEGDWIC